MTDQQVLSTYQFLPGITAHDFGQYMPVPQDFSNEKQHHYCCLFLSAAFNLRLGGEFAAFYVRESVLCQIIGFNDNIEEGLLDFIAARDYHKPPGYFKNIRSFVNYLGEGRAMAGDIELSALHHAYGRRVVVLKENGQTSFDSSGLVNGCRPPYDKDTLLFGYFKEHYVSLTIDALVPHIGSSLSHSSDQLMVDTSGAELPVIICSTNCNDDRSSSASMAVSYIPGSIPGSQRAGKFVSQRRRGADVGGRRR